MSMKLFDVLNVYTLLGRVRINKINDKQLRKDLLSDYFILHKSAKDFDEARSNIRNKYLADLPLQEAISLENQLKEATEEEATAIREKLAQYSEVYQAVRDLDSLLDEELNKEVDLDLKKIDRELFAESLTDDITLAELTVLEPIFI